MTAAPRERTARAVATVLLGLGVAAMAAALTVGGQAVRTALRTGACIAGGTGDSGLPCPRGVLASIPLVVGLGVVGAVLAAVTARRLGAPSPLVLAWAGLFLVLAWAFLDEGLLHPGAQGTRIGFVVLAGVFVVLGLAPLVTLRSRPGSLGAPRWWLYHLVSAAVGVAAGLQVWQSLSA